MKHLEISVFEVGEMVGTMTASGEVALWTVAADGTLTTAEKKLFGDAPWADEPLEALHLTVRTYNVLKRESVHTAGEMVAFYETRGEAGLLDIRNFSQKCVDEVREHVMRLRGRPATPELDTEAVLG